MHYHIQLFLLFLSAVPSFASHGLSLLFMLPFSAHREDERGSFFPSVMGVQRSGHKQRETICFVHVAVLTDEYHDKEC
jgi:hypothetical protein